MNYESIPEYWLTHYGHWGAKGAQKDNFKYLWSMIHRKRKVDDVKQANTSHIDRVAKAKGSTGMLCDKKVPVKTGG